MPKLNEYIGSIVSSITSARVMSDIQTAKVAKDYAGHELLKHFSVPRMRIDDVELTIPLALEEVKESTKSVYEPIDNKSFNALVYREIVNNLGLARLPRKISGSVQREIAKRTQIMEQQLRVADNTDPLKSFSKEMAAYTMEIAGVSPLKDTDLIREKINVEAIQSKLERALADHIKPVSENKMIDDLNIIAESHRLREEKPENIIYIKLRITEDGMEWDRTENSNTGEVESRLLPE